MKILLLTTVLWSAFVGGDRERGMQLYKEGKFQEAQVAFTAALKGDPDSAELQWNLALAAWRAGDLDTAEVAAEKYAALATDAKDELHRGMLGAIRFAEARKFEEQADQAIATAKNQPVQPDPDADEPQQPLPLLEKALQKALSARDHFVRGARANPTPEILRNTERALRKIDELKKRIEEQMKQEQKEGDKNDDQKKPEPDGKEDDQNDGEKKPDDQKKGDEKQEQNKPDENKDGKPEGQQSNQKPDDNKPQKPDGKPDSSDPQQGEGENPPESPEPKPNEGDAKAERGDQKPGDQQPEPDGKEQAGNKDQNAGDGQKPRPPEPRSDAPGEAGKGLELTPEQAQRLMERAKKLDERLKKAKKRQSSRRRAVERDW